MVGGALISILCWGVSCPTPRQALLAALETSLKGAHPQGEARLALLHPQRPPSNFFFHTRPAPSFQLWVHRG